MCYHTSLARDQDYLERRFHARFDRPRLFEPVYHHSGFSAPLHPVIANETSQAISLFRWGLVPFWARDEAAAERIRSQTLNARAETIHQKPAFRAPIMTRRCLVLVDGFYEWREEMGRKYPYYIILAGGDAFALAGIWDTWLNTRTGETRETFSIVTTTANSLMERIHNTRKRMPVILDRADEERWLEKDLDRTAIDGMLQPFDPGRMRAHTVSRLVSTKRGDSNVPEVMREHRYEGLVPIE